MSRAPPSATRTHRRARTRSRSLNTRIRDGPRSPLRHSTVPPHIRRLYTIAGISSYLVRYVCAPRQRTHQPGKVVPSLQLPHHRQHNGHRKAHRPAERHALPTPSGGGRGRASTCKHSRICFRSIDGALCTGAPVIPGTCTRWPVEGYVMHRTRFSIRQPRVPTTPTVAVPLIFFRARVTVSLAAWPYCRSVGIECSRRPGRRRARMTRQNLIVPNDGERPLKNLFDGRWPRFTGFRPRGRTRTVARKTFSGVLSVFLAVRGCLKLLSCRELTAKNTNNRFIFICRYSHL